MKNFGQTLRQHRTAIITYLVYFLVFIRSVQIETDYHRVVQENHGKWPYGVMGWDGGLLILFALVFGFVTLINAIVSKQPWFYLLLLFSIIILPFIWAKFAS